MPKLRQFRKYLKRNGWVMYKNTDHEYYMKVMPDGNILYTKCSHGDGEIDPVLWRRILKQQLHITQDDFNAGL